MFDQSVKNFFELLRFMCLFGCMMMIRCKCCCFFFIVEGKVARRSTHQKIPIERRKKCFDRTTRQKHKESNWFQRFQCMAMEENVFLLHRSTEFEHLRNDESVISDVFKRDLASNLENRSTKGMHRPNPIITAVEMPQLDYQHCNLLTYRVHRVPINAED